MTDKRSGVCRWKAVAIAEKVEAFFKHLMTKLCKTLSLAAASFLKDFSLDVMSVLRPSLWSYKCKIKRGSYYFPICSLDLHYRSFRHASYGKEITFYFRFPAFLLRKMQKRKKIFLLLSVIYRLNIIWYFHKVCFSVVSHEIV